LPVLFLLPNVSETSPTDSIALSIKFFCSLLKSKVILKIFFPDSLSLGNVKSVPKFSGFASPLTSKLRGCFHRENELQSAYEK